MHSLYQGTRQASQGGCGVRVALCIIHPNGPRNRLIRKNTLLFGTGNSDGLASPNLPLLRAGMAGETPTLDPTSTPTPIKLDDPEGEWTTPGNVRKPRLAARPSFDLHAVCVHLPALPTATSAQLLDILPAFVRAAKLPAHTCAGVSVHLRNRNRLAILKTHHIELVSRLLSVESIMLAGRIYAVAPYLAAPTNSCRGKNSILRDLDSYQADILLARRMGNTNSALITFAGMHVPFSVYYQRLEFRCRLHKSRAHHCTICLQYGHRTCACPGNQRLCPTCSTPISQPDEPHSCSPWCLHCQGHHTPFAQICPVRKQRDEACANAAKKQRLLHRQQWKSLNTSQPPVKPSNPSSIYKMRASSSLLPTHAQWGGQHPRRTQVPPTPVIQPAPSAQPKPVEYHTPAPVKQDSPLQKPMQQARIQAQDQRTSNLETLISNLTKSLDNRNSTINKAFNDAPGPIEDKNHPVKRTHPIPASSVGLAPKIKPATLLTPPNPSNNKHHGDRNNSVELSVASPQTAPSYRNGSLRKPHYLTLSYYKQQGIPKTSQATELCTPTPRASDSGPRCPCPTRSPAEHLKVPVLSPTLFNLGLAPLAKSLSEIPHLQSILHADDVTLCCTHGSPAEVEFTLQSGLNLIYEFLSRSGMQAAPEKSELLLLSATKYQRSVNPLLNLTLAGTPIPRMSSCRVLGFPLQDHSFTRAIQSTITICHQVTHLVRRVVKRRGGLDEGSLDRQLGRLSSSAQGHWLLQRAGIRPIDFPLYTPQRPLPSNLHCAPIPSNMTPHLHEGRRQARAHFHDPFPPDTVTCYVDAAYYQTHGSTACVTMPPHPRLTTAQVRTLRAIQLNTLITPARLYLYRYRSDPSCPNCPSTYANPYNPLTTLTRTSPLTGVVGVGGLRRPAGHGPPGEGMRKEAVAHIEKSPRTLHLLTGDAGGKAFTASRALARLVKTRDVTAAAAL
ncbi:hypothetical protein HPB49_007106 [Dermacentor silvarum]|uniref:Uncharacterized protein n=1 Tax=Dermacentor silvarum TaxID=543639 RepID=A0ACB8CDV6_DERSI|nr:hypothetical protein HPB49_007106 [Dermacentor silvarum]